MSEPPRSTEVESQPGGSSAAGSNSSNLFAGPPEQPSNRGKIIAAAAVAVLLALIAGVFSLKSSRAVDTGKQNAVLPPDSYAGNLSFTQLAMSQSASLSGGTSTFIDGRVKNIGPATLAGVTLQVLFRNDVGLSPQVETLPLTLIRTHEPYVDIEPVNAAPLKPGDVVEFRLIVETVAGNWNQQLPDLVVVHVSRR